MRADRLINLILLLQTRGTATAQELADELGVSKRTIYRDMDTLGEIGVPLYADHGVTGGYHLLEDYGGELNGLTRDERGSLLMLSVPDALAELEVGQKLKTALLKLYASISNGRPPRMLLDWTWWGQRESAAPHLRAVYDAVQTDRQVHIRYRLWGHVPIERVVDPYGLIFKAGVWYVIANSGASLHHYRLSDLDAVQFTGQRFDRPEGFDLETCWQAICAEAELPQSTFDVVVRASSALLRVWTEAYTVIHDEGDSSIISLSLESFEGALKLSLSLGGAVEVLAPEALRLTVQDYAAQILRRYGHAVPTITRPS